MLRRPPETAEEQMLIDVELRFVLFGLECALGVAFSDLACEQVFTDSNEDHVSAKEYLFHDSPGLAVSGRVEEYEPEMILLRIRGRRGVGEILRRAVDAAGFHAKRLRNAAGRRRKV